MMLDRLARLMRDRAPESAAGRTGPDAMQLAIAALLMEAARSEEGIAPSERARIAELLGWRFRLQEVDAAALLDAAERTTEGPASWHALTATIRQGSTDSERIRVVEMLWDVILADDKMGDLEANLMRRVAALMFVSDADSGAARRRVQARYRVAGGT